MRVWTLDTCVRRRVVRDGAVLLVAMREEAPCLPLSEGPPTTKSFTTTTEPHADPLNPERLSMDGGVEAQPTLPTSFAHCISYEDYSTPRTIHLGLQLAFIQNLQTGWGK
ncbi:hypothetical protein MHYP_G00282150 [Metynnis hypsauchen]